MYIMGKNGEGKGESIPQVCVVNYLFSLFTNLQLNHTSTSASIFKFLLQVETPIVNHSPQPNILRAISNTVVVILFFYGF